MAAIGLDAVWHYRRDLFTQRVAIGVTMLLFGLTVRGYIPAMVEALVANDSRHGLAIYKPVIPAANTVLSATTVPPQMSRSASASFAMCGATLLSSFQPVLAASELDGPFAAAARTAQQLRWLLLPISLGGLAIALRRLRLPALLGKFNALHAGYRVLVAALIIQMSYFAVVRVIFGFHYFNGTWVVFVLMLWIAIDAIRPRAGGALAICMALCSLSVTVASATPIWQHAGTRSFSYGPDLHEQTSAVRRAMQSSDVIYTDVPNFVVMPHALQTVARVQRDVDYGVPLGHDQACVISYANDNPRDAHLAVRIASMDSLSPEQYRRISLTRIEGRPYY